MSLKITNDSNTGSVELVSEDTAGNSQVVIPKSGVGVNADWTGVAVSEGDITAMGITLQGTFVSAKQYPDGSIVGSTSNGSFTMWMNGNLECTSQTIQTISADLTRVDLVLPIEVSNIIASYNYMADEAQSAEKTLKIIERRNYRTNPDTVITIYVSRNHTSSYEYTFETTVKGRWK